MMYIVEEPREKMNFRHLKQDVKLHVPIRQFSVSDKREVKSEPKSIKEILSKMGLV